MNRLIEEFLASTDGLVLLELLQANGLTAEAASQVIGATAEGALEHTSAATGRALAGFAGSTPSALTSLMGATASGQLAAPVATFVAQRLGLEPSVAQSVVLIVLPRVVAGLARAAPEQAALLSALV
jgi:predicted naringenin-chalcone synthase